MDATVVVSVTLLVMVLMLAMGVPVAFSAATAGLVGYFLFQEGVKGLLMAGTVPWVYGFNYTILALPIFVLMGHILDKSGALESLFDAFSKCLGRMPGSIGVATLLTSGGLAAASGSGAATQATMATIAWPQLMKHGYHPKFALGLLIGGGSLGPLIPPSGLLILYGAMTELSVSKLFMAALVPGLITMLLQIVYVMSLAKVRLEVAPRPERVGGSDKIRSLVHLLPFSLLVFGVLGSIYFGFATPTEAASVGCGLSLLLMILYRRFNATAIVGALRQAALTGSFILLIIVFTQAMSSVLNYYGLGDSLAAWVTGLHLDTALIFLALVVVFLILGMFIDGLSMTVLTVPLLAPFLQDIGFDLIWFGVILVILVEVGAMTPPFGLHLFIVSGTTGKSVADVLIGTVPFMLIWLSVILLLWLFPTVALWLPGTM